MPELLLDARHEAPLRRYARLLVEFAVGLREGQPLEICGTRAHRSLALRIGEAAFDAGAGEVRYRLVDPLEIAQLVRRGRREQILRHHLGTQEWLGRILHRGAALLLLDAPPDPEVAADRLGDHAPNHQLYLREHLAVSLDFQRRALDQRLCPVVLAAAPTPAWARQVFPDLHQAEAFHRLADQIFHVTFADRDDALEHAAAEIRTLEQRAAALDALALRELRITGGGNDLRVALSEHSRWCGGGWRTAAGQPFVPNLPTFEVFTTPDRRLTEGRLVASRPLRLPGGALAEGLELEFRDGRIAQVRAARGARAFERWLEVDDGARYLGEFALVDEDSPVARSGETFGHRLLDENAAAHVGIGLAYRAGLEAGDTMTPEELERAGTNHSAVHLDLPFGGAAVQVRASNRKGEETVLIEAGRWARARVA